MARTAWSSVRRGALVAGIAIATVVRMGSTPKVSPTRALAAGARSIRALAKRAASCTACPLYERATQTVFGEGPAHARAVFVGEEPADEEDRRGHPFVGPAGRLLRQMLRRVGIDEKEIYFTNAVKHFKWVPAPRGKRRIHSKPNYGEIAACHGWLEAELQLIAPTVLVCLGATAAQALFGKSFRITKSRGNVFESEWAPWSMATYHPAALLRMPDEAARAEAKAQFLEDLASVREALERTATDLSA